jgi:hypothetical protein
MIDAQNYTGFNWARQPEIRFVKEFNKVVWFGVAVAASSTNFAGNGVGVADPPGFSAANGLVTPPGINVPVHPVPVCRSFEIVIHLRIGADEHIAMPLLSFDLIGKAVRSPATPRGRDPDRGGGNRCGHRDATIVLLTYRHGLRAVEVCDLRWDQVGAVLHVPPAAPVRARRSSARGRHSFPHTNRDRGRPRGLPLPHHRTYGSVYGGSAD